VNPTLAFLADGKLFLWRDGSEPTPVESPFAQEALDEQARIRERHEWKAKTDPMRMGPMTDLAGLRPIETSGVAPGFAAGEWLYALNLVGVGGLFAFQAGEGTERRLFHHARLHLRHLARHPERPLVAFSQPGEEGFAHIGVTDPDGKRLETVTEGDSLDEAPAWVPGRPDCLVFQSAGIGRSREGHLAGLGPYHVQELDTARGDLRTLWEDPGFDFLLPRVDDSGALYCIRRPYRKHAGPALGAVVLDILLFPVRLVWAFVAFLNVFSQLFTGKPLITAGPTRREGPDSRAVMLHGMLVDARRAEKEARKGEAPGLVPRAWQLVRRAASGQEQVLAEGVAAYDLGPDGSVYWTNGTAVFHRPAAGPQRELCRANRIEWLAVGAG
jgi:hypothetical protein